MDTLFCRTLTPGWIHQYTAFSCVTRAFCLIFSIFMSCNFVSISFFLFFQCPYPLYRPPLKEGKRNLLFLFSYIFQSLRSPYFIKSLVFFNETLRWTRHGLDIHLRERKGGMGEWEGFQWERGRGEIGRRGGEGGRWVVHISVSR